MGTEVIDMGFIHCNLRVLMAERSLNIQNLKDQTTLSRTTISNLYNNYGSGVQYDTLIELCKILRCELGDLFTFVDLELDFEEITSNLKVNTLINKKITDSSEDVGKNNGFRLLTTLEVKVGISYKEKESQFDFLVDIEASIDEHMNITYLDKTTSKEYKSNLRSLNSPIYVEDHIDDKLDTFLLEWIYTYFETLES
jgi:DNA-binding Xre family transcriptional regulator